MLIYLIQDPQSEYTDEEKEAASLLNKLVGKSVNLREMQSVPKTTSSVESITSKAATLVQKFEKQQVSTNLIVCLKRIYL